LKRTPFFLGEHDLVLDAKNRLSIPAQIRKHFDSADDGALFVTLKDSVPWLYTLGHFRRLFKRQISPGLLPSQIQKKYTYLTLSLGAEVECDAQGRIVLPESILNRAGLANEGPREVTLVGAHDHLEIFARASWATIRQRLFAENEVIEQWAQESLRPPVVQYRTPPQTRHDETDA